MSEKIKRAGMCGKELHGKLWKGGGSLKCPEEWSVVIYPRPNMLRLIGVVWEECEGCKKASIKSDKKRSLYCCPVCDTPMDMTVNPEEKWYCPKCSGKSIDKHKKRI